MASAGGTPLWYDSNFLLMNVPAGLHAVEFRYVDGLETPAPRIVRVVAGQPTVYEATYRLSHPAPGEGPAVLPSFNALTNGFEAGCLTLSTARFFPTPVGGVASWSNAAPY
jgi:hypothetical protein